MLSLLAFTRCATDRAFTEGKYDDPSETRLLDDKFNEADLQQMAQTMINSLLQSPVVRNRPVVQVERVTNRTHEHVDTKSLTDKIRVYLLKSGRVRFSNKEARETLQEEYQYGEEGNIREDTRKARGKQVGADFILTGDITDNVQQVGNKKLIYYKLTLNLTNVEGNTIEWSEEKEIRKAFKKRSVSM